MKTKRPQLEITSPFRAGLNRFCLLAGAAWMLSPASLHAQEKLVAEYPWKTLLEQGKADASLVHDDAARGKIFTVTNPVSQPLRKTLATIESPAITADFYRLSGEIRYDAVEGDSYLEMWSTFPPANPGGSERSFYSRTLADENQMGKIHGTSDWREFALPFDATGSGAHPARLTFNLVLVGKGTVTLSGVKLWQTAHGTPVAFWSRAAGFAGTSAFSTLIVLGLCGVSGIIAATVKLRRRSHQDEVRRMAARDILA